MSSEAFEAWISEEDEHPRACMKDPDGQYAYPSARNAYFIWQAATAAALEEAAEVADRHSTCANDTPPFSALFRVAWMPPFHRCLMIVWLSSPAFTSSRMPNIQRGNLSLKLNPDTPSYSGACEARNVSNRWS